jgi:hypothetical protein
MDNGLISANGLTGGNSGGSGGSLWLKVGGLSGQGTIRANGSAGNQNGGGGGRIAIYYASTMSLSDSQITVTGGANNGQPGSVYIAAQPLVITGITLGSLPSIHNNLAGTTFPDPSARSIILTCKVLSGQNFIVQGSSDLVHWTNESPVIVEIQPGLYQATLSTTASQGYYRLRQQSSP